MARRSDAELAALLDPFVRVRVVQGWGLDLSLFQFDGDLSFAVFLLNADRTLYGRYGMKHARELSLDGLKQALRGALDLHRRHPADKAALAAKTGPPPPWPRPEEMPTLKTRHVKGDLSNYGCVHCHSVNEGELTSRWRAGEAIPDRLLWKYPLPQAAGLQLDGTRVKSGPGFKAGDRLLRVAGQPVLSVFDVQWALHHAPDVGELAVEVERDGTPLKLSLPLNEGWRRRLPSARNNTTSMTQMTTAGFFAEVQGGPALALRVSYLPAAKDPDPNLNAVKAGLRVGDVIVEVDGLRAKMSADDWLAYLFQKKKPGESLKLVVLRKGEPLSFDIPLPR